MSSYPAPPDQDAPHPYAPIYPQHPNAQLLDGQPPRVVPYPAPPEAGYPKLENINEVLQAQALHANHALTDPRPPPGQAPIPPMQQPQQPQQQQQQQQSNKPNRLRKACDSCSIRKVKCDESGPPCRACSALEIPCTFERPSRRRGPPNRHAEAIKKRRLEDTSPTVAHQSPQSPTNAAHALAQLQSSNPTQLSAESICPLSTMNSLIDDFFTYIHPLCPFPHEPSFREAWARREDYSNPSFLALLASMIAALVSSFPRKPRLHLKTQTRHDYPSHLSLVDKCREVCAQARGPGYLDRPGLNVYDACTSYFLGLTGAYVFQWRQLRLYFAECLTIIRSLGLHKAQEQGYTHLGAVPSAWGSNGPNHDGTRDFKLDYITEQIGRRVFWTVFVGVRTIQQLGASFGELTIAPATSTEPLPPLPVEVDDIHIFPDEIQTQQPGVVPLITGFNVNIRIFLSYSSLSTAEMAFGMDEVFDWDRQQRILEQGLHRCRQILDNLPDVLKVQSKDAQENLAQPKQQYFPPLPDFDSMRDPISNTFAAGTPDVRRYEIQKANVYASHLATRSYLVEKYFSLQEKAKAKAQSNVHSSPSVLSTGLDRFVPSSLTEAEALEKIMADEREAVVKDLLVVLGSIDMVNMEPNGDSFTQKIRSIASTLLEVPTERQGSVAQQHQEYLYKFLEILNKLERASPEASDPNANIDEETELRLWADLRDHQLKFQEQGGVYGFS
ncbi:hypothetical protein C7974DRAFT_14361 [Boeremia exigua]|uniref:uncharacterized protein n=1 Tax=Boeremia exigua TaxID=749465 RepID=UPI001E8CFDB7|nr:uncharacterized protein C7974DRAFT_14361 [Boeremia exigua]KAH6644102.1 hypothetical protein C7974DRAFT_14361 [Boeremia exigua]